MAWVPPTLPEDADTNTERILDGLAEQIPGWVPYDGDPLVVLASTLGAEVAALAQRARASIETAVAGIGETVFGVPAFPATSASLLVEVVLTANDVLGPEFIVVGTTPAGVDVAFTPAAETALPVGAPQIPMVAVTPGADGNGVPIGPLTVATATATVVTAAAVTPSTGGSDAELLDAYLDRLSRTLATLRFGGVRADDLAALSRSVSGVHRAYGVDLYNPANPAVPAERTVTVFPVDEAGQPVSAQVKTALANHLEQLREVNFIVHIADPTYTPLTVTYAAVAEAGAIPEVVHTEIDATLGRYLSPATWGSTDADPQDWQPSGTVRYLDLARLVGSVPGVAFLQALTINGGTGDVALAGAAPLPAAGPTITGTVT